MFNKLKDSVVVITGASSGIGRAAAEAFAREGAVVVLAARREAALNDVAHHCQTLGARTLVVPTDVTDEQAVERLARQATERFGRIDAWINNAAVSLFARFEEAPSDAYRRVIETNLFGYIYGARSAMRRFREQGRGVLVNVASVVSSVPQPYTSAYSITKAAIRHLSDSIRMELHLDRPHDIHVCTVLPASIDTPIFQQAANYTGRTVKALDPVNPAAMVADAMVRTVKAKPRECVVGRGGRQIMTLRALAPGAFERLGARTIDRDHLQDRPSEPSPGNLFEPLPQYASVSGGWLRDEAHGAKAGGFALAGVALAAAAAALWWAADAECRRTIARRLGGWNRLAGWLNGRLRSRQAAAERGQQPLRAS